MYFNIYNIKLPGPSPVFTSQTCSTPQQQISSVSGAAGGRFLLGPGCILDLGGKLKEKNMLQVITEAPLLLQCWL